MTRTIFGDPDNLWEKYSAAGDRAFKRQQYKEAETCWLNALRIAQDLTRSQYMLHVSLIRLSLLYKLIGKDSEADELLKWSRRLWDVNCQLSLGRTLRADSLSEAMPRTH